MGGEEGIKNREGEEEKDEGGKDVMKCINTEKRE